MDDFLKCSILEKKEKAQNKQPIKKSEIKLEINEINKKMMNKNRGEYKAHRTGGRGPRPGGRGPPGGSLSGWPPGAAPPRTCGSLKKME